LVFLDVQLNGVSCSKKAKNTRLPVASRNATKNREADVESAADNDPDHV